MSAFPSGLAPRRRIVSAARVAVIGIFVVAAQGCATAKAPSYAGNRPAQAYPQVAAKPARSEVEDDGLPAQVPGRPMRPEEDEPAEPWSPNYGRGVEPKPLKPAKRTYEAAVPVPRAAPTRMADADADLIVARAISAHEMRRQ